MIDKVSRIIRHSQFNSKFNQDGESKPLFPLMFDLMIWTLINRGAVTNFFLLGLDKKDRKISNYLNFRSFKKSYKDFYPPNYLCLLEDKQIFEKFINNFPEYAPKNIGYLTKYHFYLPDAIPQPIENILNYPMKCIVKDIWGFGGKDIFILTITSGNIYINDKISTVEELIHKLPQRAVLQEILEQHEDLKKLHPPSLNTARIVTVNTGKKVHVISTYLRIGANGSFVDNFSKGNIYVYINRDSGKLDKVGRSSHDPLIFYSHPQTNIVFDGYEIPFIKESIAVCQKLHYQLPYFFILGWDIAFTPKGPVVIESNNIHQIVDEQLTEGGLKKQFDIYKKEFMENKLKERKLNYA